jgi:hypothetical protein
MYLSIGRASVLIQKRRCRLHDPWEVSNIKMPLAKLTVDERIILNCILWKYGVRAWT